MAWCSCGVRVGRSSTRLRLACRVRRASVLGRWEKQKALRAEGASSALTVPTLAPAVLFATPGMLHAGQSLQIFRKWAGNEKNMVRGLGPRAGSLGGRGCPIGACCH